MSALLGFAYSVPQLLSTAKIIPHPQDLFWLFLLAIPVKLSLVSGTFDPATGQAIVAFQAYYVWPANRCEAKGDWWDPEDHVCAVPMPISQFTGRKIGNKEVVMPKPVAAPSTPPK